MTPTDLSKYQTMMYRHFIAEMVKPMMPHAEVIPAGWNNNLHWHLGHLVTVPRALTLGLLGEPLGIPDDYRKWFAKGTSPATWGDDPVPSAEHLLRELTGKSEALFDELAGKEDVPFPKTYTVTIGIDLTSVAVALPFSMSHDGIHLGLLLALRRALK